jgi:hypothetical protein
MGLFDTILIYDWKLERASKITALAGQYVNVMSKPGATLEGMDVVTPGAVTVTGAGAGASNGAGGNLVRLTVSPNTSGMSTAKQQTQFGQWYITQATGTAPFLAAIYNGSNNANSQWGVWAINIVDGTHVDLLGSTFAGSYTSGGVLGGNIELIPFSFDNVSSSTLPAVAAFNQANQLGFFNGATLEAIIETGEQGGNEKRMFVKAFRVISDANFIVGNVSFRDNPQAAYNYTAETGLDQTGACLVAGGGIDTRYSRARIRIPAGTPWTYAMAIEPDAAPTGSY